jgi:hypothetical protein
MCLEIVAAIASIIHRTRLSPDCSLELLKHRTLDRPPTDLWDVVIPALGPPIGEADQELLTVRHDAQPPCCVN